MIKVNDLVDIDEVKPVEFHPYRSLVSDKLISVEYDSETYLINMFEKDLYELFNSKGIQCQQDDKVVFECIIRGIRLYIGFTDWRMSIGFDMIKSS